MKRLAKWTLLLALPFTLYAAESPKLETQSLTVTPAVEPVPALKYQLLPELRDQISGNAATYYRRELILLGTASAAKEYVDLSKWLELPPKELPQKEVGAFLEGHSRMFRQLETASQCDHCDWEVFEALKRENYRLYLEEVYGLLRFARLLELRARFQIAERHFDEAFATIRIGMTMARHASLAPTLVSTLISGNIGKMMLHDISLLEEVPDAPNLYWALAHLPQPFFDIRRAMEGERLMLAEALHDLKPSREGLKPDPLLPERVQDLVVQLDSLLSWRSPEYRERTKLDLILATAKGYPAARRFLLSQNWTDAEIDRLPVVQTVATHALHRYDRVFDEFMKCIDVPYAQAKDLRSKAKQSLSDEGAREEQGNGPPIVGALFHFTDRVFDVQMHIDRHIAALRTIEGIRLHAAENAGKLPARLEDIKTVPVPVDPQTGKSFEYTVDGDTFILLGPPPEGQSQPRPESYLRFEVKLKRK